MSRMKLAERGVALALVLWLVVVLGATAAAIVASVRRGSGAIVNAQARTVAHSAAKSGIVAGVALLKGHMSGAYTPVQRRLAFNAADREFAQLREVAMGQSRFAVKLTNLSGRLDLNQADPEALAGLFSQFTSSAAARALVDALQDWRDADSLVRAQGAEARSYLRAGSPYLPTNAPLTRVDELSRLPGATRTLVQAVTPYVTVDGDLLLDVNAAPETVLAAIPGIGPMAARTLIAQRKGVGAFASVTDVQSLLGGDEQASASVARLTIAPSRLLLVSRGWKVGHPLTHEIQAAYAVVGTQLRLQSWRERDL